MGRLEAKTLTKVSCNKAFRTTQTHGTEGVQFGWSLLLRQTNTPREDGRGVKTSSQPSVQSRTIYTVRVHSSILQGQGRPLLVSLSILAKDGTEHLRHSDNREMPPDGRK